MGTEETYRENHERWIRENTELWEKVLIEIFSGSIPRSAEWTDIPSMLNVLNQIGGNQGLSHVFYPKSGGNDLRGARVSRETDCMELNLDGLTSLVKPSVLSFQSFEDAPHEWSYFYLETYELEPTGVYPEYSLELEELTEVAPLDYRDRTVWDQGFYDDHQGNMVKLPPEARSLSRWFNGSFVCFAKASTYNGNSSTYDGRHSTFGRDGFKKHIQSVIDHLACPRI